MGPRGHAAALGEAVAAQEPGSGSVLSAQPGAGARRRGMGFVRAHRVAQCADWRPSPVVALAPSPDGCRIAAARESGDIEIWSTAHGSSPWALQQRIGGAEGVAISALLWHPTAARPALQPAPEPHTADPRGRSGGAAVLLSSSLDGHVTVWDLQRQQPQAVSDSFGGPVWALVLQPSDDRAPHAGQTLNGDVFPAPASGTLATRARGGKDGGVQIANGARREDCAGDAESSEAEEEEDAASVMPLAVACDDGCVRLFALSRSAADLSLLRTLPRTAGRVLSVAWHRSGLPSQAPSAGHSAAWRLFSGSSQGSIHCWDVAAGQEVYRITVGIGGRVGPQQAAVGDAREEGAEEEATCVWSLLTLREEGVLVSGDSQGSTQFWDAASGTLLVAHTRHRGDVLALAATPGQGPVFAAGADGKVSCYERLVGVGAAGAPVDDLENGGQAGASYWAFVGARQSHSHHIRTLAVALLPPSLPGEDSSTMVQSRQQAARAGQAWALPGSAGAEALAQERERQRWQGSGVAVLLSGGEDARILTYPAGAFMAYHPFCICPAPQLPACEASLTAPGVSPATGTPGVSLATGMPGAPLSRKQAPSGAASRIVLLQQPLWVDLWCASAPGSQARRGPATLANTKAEEARGGAKAEEASGGTALGARRQRRLQGEGVRVEAGERVEEGLVSLAARVRTAGPGHIVCSSISSDGSAFALSDAQGTRLYALERVALPSLAEGRDSVRKNKRRKGAAPAEARAGRHAEEENDAEAEAEGATEWRVHRLRWQVGAADAAVLAQESSPSAAAERGRTDQRPSTASLSSTLLPPATRLAFIAPRPTGGPSPHTRHKRGLPNGSVPGGDRAGTCLALATISGKVLVLEVGQEGSHPHTQASSPDGRQRLSLRLVHSWRPFASEPRAAPVTCLCSSGRWLVAACAGGVVAVFDLDHGRHHWTLPRLDSGSLITACTLLAQGVPGPGQGRGRAVRTPLLLAVGTSACSLHVFQLQERAPTAWSQHHAPALSRALQAHLQPGGGIRALAAHPHPSSPLLLLASSSCVCLLDLGAAVLSPTPAVAKLGTPALSASGERLQDKWGSRGSDGEHASKWRVKAGMRTGPALIGVPSRGPPASPGEEREERPGGAQEASSDQDGALAASAGVTLVHLAQGTVLLHALGLGPQDLLLLEQSWEEALHTMALPRAGHKFGT